MTITQVEQTTRLHFHLCNSDLDANTLVSGTEMKEENRCMK
jgi:hypothetical protein